ncbi:hypothetical protein HN51_045353 [Arachis hypogaea]
MKQHYVVYLYRWCDSINAYANLFKAISSCILFLIFIFYKLVSFLVCVYSRPKLFAFCLKKIGFCSLYSSSLLWNEKTWTLSQVCCLALYFNILFYEDLCSVL